MRNDHKKIVNNLSYMIYLLQNLPSISPMRDETIHYIDLQYSGNIRKYVNILWFFKEITIVID